MRKNFEVIDTVYVDEDENIVLEPGDIVEIEPDELNDSIAKLVENIEYWFDTKFDEYFKED